MLSHVREVCAVLGKGDSAISSVRDLLLPFYIYNMGRPQHAS